MEQEKKSSFRTLLLSVLFSASGPIVLGLGLLVGHSSTQIADFTRRTAELLALIVALIVYSVTNKRQDMTEERKKDLMAQNRVKDGMMFKLDFDPRIIGNEILPDGTKKTGIGDFIRRTSLDEFPQFFCVLSGTMSTIGDRVILGHTKKKPVFMRLSVA